MMKNTSIFLDKIINAKSKQDVFLALFEARGCGADINTNHVFFQEVIVKFNASKTKAVIQKSLPYETDSHYIDVALARYMEIGENIKLFNKDLEVARKEYAKTHPFIKCAKEKELRLGA